MTGIKRLRGDNPHLQMEEPVYIDDSGHRYYKGTEQYCSKAPFLILMNCNKRWAEEYEGKKAYLNACPVCPHRDTCQPEELSPKKLGRSRFKEKIRGIIRKVALHQLGHFMMGTARIKNHSITLSGSYGGDGLPKDVDPDIYILGTVLPDELREAWNTGGGWNSCGTEAPAMVKWALSIK
jgi:hypothetical protein